jgi:hypothetical protein
MIHMPNGLTVGGFSSVNSSTVCTVFQNCSVLGLNTHFGACSWFKHTMVHFGEPISARLKEENGGGLISSSFGRLRCRKSLARGFWTSWIHWNCYQGHLKTSSAIFSPLKFQQALGSLKPSLIEDMFW